MARMMNGEDYLDRLEAVQVKLESGEKLVFSLQPEMSVPDSAADLLRAAKRAPARLAFWAYQADRALRQVRSAEFRFDQEHAMLYLAYKEIMKQDGEHFISDKEIQARIDFDDRIIPVIMKLNEARNQYNMLRSIRDAVEQRCFVLRRLLGVDRENFS